jgi:hypothetical protein
MNKESTESPEKVIDEQTMRDWMNDMCAMSAEECPRVIATVANQSEDIREAFLKQMEHDIKRLVLMHRVANQRLTAPSSSNRQDNLNARRRTREVLRKAALLVRGLDALP